MALALFLTAYDPSDLPGGSLDPLGFERGYIALADLLLPGMTNVAGVPRYFSLICAGAQIASTLTASTPKAQHQLRTNCLLRFERIWALANVLASKVDDALDVSGLRGIWRVSKLVDKLEAQGEQAVDLEYELLSRQERYGAIGIYGAVAAGLRLWDRKSMQPTPDLGESLGEAFATETRLPKALREAALKGGHIELSTLTEWGRVAHLDAPTMESEAKFLREAAERDPIRCAMLELLESSPYKRGEAELARLKRVADSLEGESPQEYLLESIRLILAYEAAYRLALLGFERMLFLCRRATTARVGLKEAQADPVIVDIAERLAPEVSALEALADGCRSDHAQSGLKRLGDVRRFLQACRRPSAEDLVNALLGRHSDVQRGKWDQGRPKLPWLQIVDQDIELTLASAGVLTQEPLRIDQISAHPYRLLAADALRRAGRTG